MKIHAVLKTHEVEEACSSAAPLTLTSDEVRGATIQLNGPFRVRLHDGCLQGESPGMVTALIRDVPITRAAPRIRFSILDQALTPHGEALTAAVRLQELTLRRPPGVRALATNSRLRGIFPPGSVQTLAVEQFLEAMGEGGTDISLSSGKFRVNDRALVVETDAIISSSPPPMIDANDVEPPAGPQVAVPERAPDPATESTRPDLPKKRLGTYSFQNVRTECVVAALTLP